MIPEAAARGAALLARAWERHQERFGEITARAPRRFAARDWRGALADAVERLEAYGQGLDAAVAELSGPLGPELRSRALWTAMKEAFATRVGGRGDVELAETFFSSASRRVFATVGVDADVEFVAPATAALLRVAGAPVAARYPPDGGTTAARVESILRAHAPEARWADLARDAHAVADRLERRLGGPPEATGVEAIEVVRPLFYRNKGAYLVGRILAGAEVIPFVVALAHPAAGVEVDAVLFERDDVSRVFSFTRAYFQVAVPRPYETVRFLKSLLPAKPISELYAALGHPKHGKTVLYRELLAHLADTDEPFVAAPGAEGLVMAVFTLPSFDVVFKVIRDRFGAPKTTTRADVLDRYRLVARLDRAGRLLDAQEFEHLEFERSRFSPRLLDRLREVAGASVEAGSVRVAIRHLYTERRVTPLDLHLASAGEEEAIAAVLDYGRAIKDLAASNVFPGDLLTKNFGVTRHGRVVFYDYDEISTIDRCRFRSLPDSADGDGAGDAAPFYVDPADVFPEELGRFLGFGGRRREAFLDVHGDLFTTGFWLDVQARIRAGELPDLFPYPLERRLRPSD
jgi:isocitrate dehydrogenase kinase/phosphatase